MKKFICLLIMFWLPFSMAMAQIMSADMMLKADLHATQIYSDVSPACHKQVESENTNQQTSHQCTHCNACFLASAGALIINSPALILLDANVNKHATLSVSFSSRHSAPVIKPPILN